MNKKDNKNTAIKIIALIILAIIGSVWVASHEAKQEEEIAQNIDGFDSEIIDLEEGENTNIEQVEAEDLDMSLSENQDEVYQLDKPDEDSLVAIMKTNKGDIKIKLLPEAAPKAVENFITHSKNGYYDGLTFHRVIKDFMIQGGDPLGDGTGGESIWGEGFDDEFNTTARHYYGALSMANAGPGTKTNTSQFFIVTSKKVEPYMIQEFYSKVDEEGFKEFIDKGIIEKYETFGGTPWLDFGHTVFGQVYEGLDIIDEISNVEVDMEDKPMSDIVINTIKIIE